MFENESNWNIVEAADDVLSIDARPPSFAVNPQKLQDEFDLGGSEAQMSQDQQQALENKFQILQKFEEANGGGGSVSDEELVGVIRASDMGLEDEEAKNIVEKYRKRFPSESAILPDQTPPQEMFPSATESDDFAGPNPPPIGPTVVSKYKGKFKKNKTKKHLKGKGPVADKANEIYHAIMREKGKDEPSKDEQASAAAIAWSQAKKTMKKKAYFRGVEAKVVDSYRGMWGEELIRLSVNGETVDVPRELVEFVSTEVIDPVAQLKEFVSHISTEPDTRAEIQANIANLKTAKDIAYRLVVEASDHLSEMEEASIDTIHASCENQIQDLEERLASFYTEEDQAYVEDLPKYDIGKEIVSSNFTRESDGWMDEVIEKMAADAEEIDIEKLANEDPIVFVNGLSSEIIADAPTVRRLATERVEAAAGPLDEETKQEVVSAYIEKAENFRRKKLAALRVETSEEVEQQQKIANSIPDEGLFL